MIGLVELSTARGAIVKVAIVGPDGSNCHVPYLYGPGVGYQVEPGILTCQGRDRKLSGYETCLAHLNRYRGGCVLERAHPVEFQSHRDVSLKVAEIISREGDGKGECGASRYSIYSLPVKAIVVVPYEITGRDDGLVRIIRMTRWDKTVVEYRKHRDGENRQ